MFSSIVAAPADPILGLAELFQADPRKNKINLGIGVYKDDLGQTPVLASVKQAESYLLATEKTKNYLGIEGMANFAAHTQKLLLGKNSPLLSANRVRTAQTPGGTAALRVLADFITNNTQAKRIWISNPTWPNHKSLFTAAGLQVCEYQYYDNHCLNFAGMLESLQQAQAGDVVLLHGCCHNPTGIDPTLEQWQILADMSASKGWLPLFDFAYQGFARSLEEDAQGLRIFAEKHDEMLLASSYSKNFGLYNERVGACTLIAANSQIANNAFSQIKICIRTNYSNPPAHGAAVVSTIFDNPELRALWESELSTMRQRIHTMRQRLVATLQAKGIQQDFNFINQQNGMFSYSGLNPAQVKRLWDEFGICMVSSGRINVAGITNDNLDPLCEAIARVVE